MQKTNLIAALGLATVVFAAMASCQEDDPNQVLTTNASMMANGGNGGVAGTTTDGGNAGSAGSGNSSGGEAGAGGAEPTINGCQASTAVDMTGMALVNVDIPGSTYCLKVSAGTEVTFTITPAADHQYMGGTVDENDIKLPDPSSPVYDCCPGPSPFVCCDAVNNETACGAPNPPTCSPPFDFSLVGVFPWYDNKHADTIRGVVYVVP